MSTLTPTERRASVPGPNARSTGSRRRGKSRMDPTRNNTAAGHRGLAARPCCSSLPVLWMVLTSFHSETDAATNPPSIFAPLTLDGYQEFFGATSGASPWPSLINSATAVDRLHHPGAAAGHPGRVRPVDPAGEEVDRRDVLLPVHQDAAGRRRAPADLPDRQEHRRCWTTSGSWSSCTPR